MKNKKGFTLIELLAVIVILAIIALIATPIVLNIIKDSKDSATLRSADFYIDAVENSLGRGMLDGSKIENGYYTIMKDGNLCLESDGKTCKKGLIEVEVSGKAPENGFITIIGSKLKGVDLLIDNKKIFKYNDEIVFNNGAIELSESVGTIIYEHEIEAPNLQIEYDAILDGVTTPTIPAKVTYKNGEEKNVTFYYTGTQTQNNHTYDEITTGMWAFFENGEVTQNADGTYSGTGIGITLHGNTREPDFFGEIFYSGSHHYLIGDFLDTYESVEILGDIASSTIEVGFNFFPTGSEFEYENGKPIGVKEGELIPYFEDGTKVRNIILTFEDNSQELMSIEDCIEWMKYLLHDDPDIIDEFITQEALWLIYGIPAPTAAWNANGDSGIIVTNKKEHRFNKLIKLTIEEEINGRLERKTFDVKEFVS